MEEAGKGVHRWRVWTIRIALVLLALPAAEVAFRAACRVKGTSYARADTEATLLQILSAIRDPVPIAGGQGGPNPRGKTPNRLLHPYYGWETRRGAKKVSAHLFAEEPSEDYVIWIVGGSVAAVFGEDDRGGAPELVAGLREDPRFADKRLRVESHGRGGFKQPQQLNLVAYLLALGPQPDAVINLDGYNEVGIASINASGGVHPAYPSAGQWGTLAVGLSADPGRLEQLVAIWRHKRKGERLVERTLETGLHRSAILGWIAVKRMRRIQADWAAAQEVHVSGLLGEDERGALQGPSIGDDPERAYDAMARNWFESSRSLHALCAARGIHYLHVLQPTLHDTGSKPLTEAEQETGTAHVAAVDGVQTVYPRLRDEGRRLQAEGIAFYDASQVFADVEETLYFDACHFYADGNRMLGVAMAEAFLASLDG